MKQPFASVVILLAALALMTFFSCTKNNSNPPVNALTAHTLAGTYTGTTFHKYRTSTGTSNHQDSSTRTDTFVVTAIGPDSFLLSQPAYEPAKTGFKLGNGLSFSRTEGTLAFGRNFYEISLVFDTSKRSLSVDYHHVAMNSWIMEDWDSFNGTK